MARPRENGLQAFLMDVDFFTNPNIRRLRRSFGSDGPLLFVYLLCRAFQSGYYLEYTRDLAADASEDLQCAAGKVSLIVRRIVEWKLLRLIELRGRHYLTSAEIQRRYQVGMRNRGKARTVSVDGSLWILQKEETEGFIQVRPFCENCGSEGQNAAQNKEISGPDTASNTNHWITTEKTGVSTEKTPAIVVEKKNRNTTTSLRSSSGAPETGRTAPTKEEVLKAAVQMGLRPELGVKFFYHYQDSGWIDGKGRDVCTWWRKKLSYWGRDEWEGNSYPRPGAAAGRPAAAGEPDKLDALRRMNRRLRGQGGEEE